MLDYLKDPAPFMPGNKMPYAGVKDEADRHDLMVRSETAGARGLSLLFASPAVKTKSSELRTSSAREFGYPLGGAAAYFPAKGTDEVLLSRRGWCIAVAYVVAALHPSVPSYVSVFAGRIADTGVDPIPLMSASIALASTNPNAEVIWASPRELLNVFQANAIGCHVITVTHDVLKKLSLVGYDLAEYSLDTVKMFHADATQAGYRI